MQRFRGGLVFKAHRLLYHSTLGLRVIKKKKKVPPQAFSQVIYHEGSTSGCKEGVSLPHSGLQRDFLNYPEVNDP